MSIQKEEMNINGNTMLGQILSKHQIDACFSKISEIKSEDIKECSREQLVQWKELESVRDLARFKGLFFDILENKKLNEFIDEVLNDKAIVLSYNAIVMSPSHQSNILGAKFHRDQAWFKDTRLSVLIMIPLVDFTIQNGCTQVVSGTHLFKRIPSNEFLENHKTHMECKAGHAFAIDGTLWHKAGENTSNEERPVIVIHYGCAFLKQQIDFCNTVDMSGASEKIKSRLGFNCRVRDNHLDFRRQEKMWKPGQFDASNTNVHEHLPYHEYL